MQIDKKKLERQQKGSDAWFNTNTSNNDNVVMGASGTLNYATGVGKTYTAILIIKKLFRINPLHNIVIIVPSESLQKQWNVVLKDNFTKKDLIKIEVFTAHWVNLNKVKMKTNTLIADELHEYLSEEFIKVINGTYIRFDNNLGLTATYEDSKGRHKLIKDLYPIIDKITEESAIKEGYISPYIEFNYEVLLTAKEQEEYEYYSKIISENINKFGKGGLDLATKCLSGGTHSDGKKYDNNHFVFGWASHKGWHTKLDMSNPRDEEINAIWNPHIVFGYAQKLLNAIRMRKNLLYACGSKLTATVEITQKFKELKTIVFSQTTNFADKLHLRLNDINPNSAVVYHSQLNTIMLPSPSTGKLIKFGKTRLKKMALDAITTGKSRIICTASSLDKGFDVPDINLGITASGTSNFTQYIQRGGRVKRKDMFQTNKVVLLVNLYIKNTKDEIWLNKRQSKAKHKIYWVNSLEDITLTPVDTKIFTIDEI